MPVTVLTVAVMLAGVAMWALIGIGIVAEPTEVAPTPGSEAHLIATELLRTGAIGDFRAIEPGDGWEVEYELEPDSVFGGGFVRSRGAGASAEIEYQAFDDELDASIADVAEGRGFNFDPDWKGGG